MTKLAAVWLALVLSAGAIFAQGDGNFRVVRVVGSVESSKLNRVIKTEDLIPEGDHLKFNSKNDYVILFHPKLGRKRIQGIPDSQPREFNILLQSFVKPDEKSTGTRGSDQAYIERLKVSLQDTVLILGDGTIELDPTFLSLIANYYMNKGLNYSL